MDHLTKEVIIGCAIGTAFSVLIVVILRYWIQTTLKEAKRIAREDRNAPERAPRRRPEPPSGFVAPQVPRLPRASASRWSVSRTSREGMFAIPPLPPLPNLDFTRVDQALARMQEHIDSLGHIDGLSPRVTLETDGQEVFANVNGQRFEVQRGQENVIPMADGSFLTITASADLAAEPPAPTPKPEPPPKRVAPTAWERLMNEDEPLCPTTKTTSAPKKQG